LLDLAIHNNKLQHINEFFYKYLCLILYRTKLGKQVKSYA
jgi:hypothetical protein